MAQWRSGAVTGRRGYPPRLRNGSPRRQVVTLWYPPRTIENESRFPGKAAGRGVRRRWCPGLSACSAIPLPVRSPLSPPPHWSYQIFPKCDLQAGGGAGSKQAVSDYVSQVLFQEAGSRRVPTARADASRLRTLRSMPLYWFFLGSGARVLGAAWGSADRRPGGATAPETATQAAAAARARPAPARCLVLGRCRSPAPYCGSMASSATWSACRAKVPGQDALRTAIQGRGRVLRPRARAAALRRVRPPRRREGLFVCER